MMDEPGKRGLLHEKIGQYISDTLSNIYTIKDFIERVEKWFLWRKAEIDKMKDIEDRAEKIVLDFDHVKNSEKRARAFGEYLKSALSSITSDSRRQELEKELGRVLEDTHEGLEKLQYFLEAVEKLAVTSLFVFSHDRYLPKGLNGATVRSVITAARMSAPLLVHFKRDDAAFFLPNLSNLEVLIMYLEKYVDVTKLLIEKLEKRVRYMSDHRSNYWRLSGDQGIGVSVDGSGQSIQTMLDHLIKLNAIRSNPDTRLTFLLQEASLSFIGMFSQRHDRMLKFLSELEDSATQLDRMRFGASVSTVAGSSVGVAGGVLSIVGLALAPVTAGVSLALTFAGVGLGVTSGVNSLVTGVTEMAVNKTQSEAANSIFQRFMKDVERFVECLDVAASSETPVVRSDEVDTALGAGKAVLRAGAVIKGVDGLVDAASAVKALQTEEVVASAVKLGLQEAKAGRNIPKLASDLPDIGQLAKGTPVAFSKAARSGFIALNALFIGLDVFFICKDSISLSKGSKSEVAQLIRSRSTLWRSELESWERIHDSLCRGIWRYRRSQRVLEQPFYL